ncbi:hypothetical protein [Primorskyibacter sp. S87]|uniref:hypothetical protein n=1 Tax=Primorskyibacter sp. S87 TaxID=3415126 RepID=UPI003C7C9CFA
MIANQELAEAAAESGEVWADMVTTLPGFEIQVVEAQLAEALEHAGGLANPDILEFAFSIGVLRGGIEVMQGRIPASDIPAWLLLDGASRGALGFAGAQAGGWLGLVAIGPAGALVLGPAIGCAALLGNSAVKNKAQELLMRNWISELLDLGSELHSALTAALEGRIRHLSDRTTKLPSVSSSEAALNAWMAARSQDDLVAAIEDLSELGEQPTKEEHCIELLFKASDLAPANGCVLSSASKLRRKFGEKPGLQELLVGKKLDMVGSAYDKHLRSRLGSWFARG